MEILDVETLLKYSKTVRVLYIEPDETKRDDIFRDFFQNIDIAVDGRDGLEHFYNNKYDLIITHINMPKMNGIDLLTKIREISKNVTVLVISSHKNYFVELIKLGIDGFILKPIEREQFISILTKVIEKLQNKQELYEYRTKLEEKVNDEIVKRTTTEKMLLQQSKLAVMGEMIDAVAHQWRQPINNINMHVDMIQYDFEDDLIDKDYIKEFQETIFTQVLHMNNTLNEFRSFFRPDKKIVPFHIFKAIDSVLILIKDELLKNVITVDVKVIDDFTIDGIENEFKHVLINILNNAKDALNENTVKDKKITITTKIEEGMNKIYILDNAGGIPEFIIDDIFDANVTSKAQSNGTGIGLYMSKLIVEKYNGTIIVENDRKNNGALFTITFNNQD